MRHFLQGGNVGLVVARQTTDDDWSGVQISDHIIDNRYHFTYRGIPSQFPLYLYPDAKQQNIDGQQNRVPNLNQDIVQTITNRLGLRSVLERVDNEANTLAPIDLLDYIYAVLHSPSYRERYKEFLKTDFPRVPYPTDKNLFGKLVKLGGELRALHLMESPTLAQLVTGYPPTATTSYRSCNTSSPTLKIALAKSISTRRNTLKMCPKLPGTFTSAATSPHKNG